MANVQHADLAAGVIHILSNWTYANAAARTGASGFIAGDVGKVAWQTNNNTFWVLLTTGPTWQGLAVTTQDLPADATKYLDGTGAYSVPAGGGGGGGLDLIMARSLL